MDHRLLVVGIGAADVGRDEDAMADAVEGAAGTRRLLSGHERRRGDGDRPGQGKREEQRATGVEHRLILWRHA